MCSPPLIRRPGAWHQRIPEQRLGARAVDQDVSRLKHRHRVLRRDDGRRALHGMLLTRIDEIAEGALDGVERAEPQGPSPQQSHQVRRNGLPETRGPPRAPMARRSPPRSLHRCSRCSSSQSSRPRGTARAGPSGSGCSRVAFHTGGRRTGRSTGAVRLLRGPRALRRGRALGPRGAAFRSLENRIAGAFASSADAADCGSLDVPAPSDRAKDTEVGSIPAAQLM